MRCFVAGDRRGWETRQPRDDKELKVAHNRFPVIASGFEE